MVEDITDPQVKGYLAVTESFLGGLVRIWRAEAAFARLMLALVRFHAEDRPGVDGPAATVLEHLDRIPYSSYDALSYVTNVSHLVYATTLLDTFLSDTTLFLFLLNPQAIGKDQQISLRTLINARSRNEAITEAAVTRMREIGYLSFNSRIDFLRKRFGLNITLPADVVDALHHYPSIRNTAVHDQGIYELGLHDDGTISSRQKTCPQHPTKITGKDVQKAIEAYERVAQSVAGTVFAQVLKQGDHPRVQSLLRVLSSGDG
jgi:hypothetical protein